MPPSLLCLKWQTGFLPMPPKHCCWPQVVLPMAALVLDADDELAGSHL